MSDQDPNENSAKAEPTAVKNELEELKSQLEKSKTDYLYLKAEFETFRRNAAKERSDLLKYGVDIR